MVAMTPNCPYGPILLQRASVVHYHPCIAPKVLNFAFCVCFSYKQKFTCMPSPLPPPRCHSRKHVLRLLIWSVVYECELYLGYVWADKAAAPIRRGASIVQLPLFARRKKKTYISSVRWGFTQHAKNSDGAPTQGTLGPRAVQGSISKLIRSLYFTESS